MTPLEFQKKYEPFNQKWDYHPVYWGKEIIEDTESILQYDEKEGYTYKQKREKGGYDLITKDDCAEFTRELIVTFKHQFIDEECGNPICPDKPYCLRFVGPDNTMLIAKKKGIQFIGNKERILSNPKALNAKKTGKKAKNKKRGGKKKNGRNSNPK